MYDLKRVNLRIDNLHIRDCNELGTYSIWRRKLYRLKSVKLYWGGGDTSWKTEKQATGSNRKTNKSVYGNEDLMERGSKPRGMEERRGLLWVT